MGCGASKDGTDVAPVSGSPAKATLPISTPAPTQSSTQNPKSTPLPAPEQQTSPKQPMPRHGSTMMAPTNTGTDAPPRPEDEVDDIMDDSKPLLAGSKSGFHTDYDIGTDLGSGSFSVVKAATHRETGNIVAVKCIRRASLPADEREALRDEVSILRELDHPNIIAMHDFYEEEQNFYLVMEVMEGGELFDRIVQKSYYNEKEARDLVKILLNSMQYLHVRNIVHRDLKPENLLLANKQDDSNIRLADFGFAKRVIKPLKTQCGTPGYVAPEILRGDTYGLSVDMWSIGVITYILLGGYPPFHDDNQSVLYKKIKAGEFVFHPEYWDPVSPEAKDLITRMLCVDHTKRLTAEDALDHPWIAGMSDQELQAHDLNGTLTEIRKFNARRKLKGTIKAVMAATKMKRLLEGLTRAGSSMSLEEKKSAEEKLRVESVKVLQKMYRQWKERKTEREGGCEAVETSAPEVTS